MSFNTIGAAFGGFGRTITGCTEPLPGLPKYDAVNALNSPDNDVQMLGAKSKHVPFHILVAYIEIKDEKMAAEKERNYGNPLPATVDLRKAAFDNLQSRKI